MMLTAMTMKNKITTADCKQAIVDYIAKHPGCIANRFVDIQNQANFERPAQLVKSWKRFQKFKVRVATVGLHSVPTGTIVRAFECSATEEAQEYYEDCLRAYTYDDGHTFIKIIIDAE